jgi:uncharacterized protein YndB with AHSA1/START domain
LSFVGEASKVGRRKELAASKIEHSIVIDRPIEEVFDFVHDPRKVAEPLFSSMADRELEASLGHLKELMESGPERYHLAE